MGHLCRRPPITGIGYVLMPSHSTTTVVSLYALGEAQELHPALRSESVPTSCEWEI